MGRNRLLVGKRIFFWLLLVMIPGFILFNVVSGRIAGKIETMLKSQIETEVRFESSTVDLFSLFPYAGISLHNVMISGSNQSNFIGDGDITFVVHPLKSIWGELDVLHLRISDATIHVERLENGYNYQVFKPDQNSSPENSGVTFTIQNADLSNIHFSFLDQKNKQDYRLLIQDGTVRGSFTSEHLSFETDLELFSKEIEIQGKKYFKGASLLLKGQFEINLHRKFYSFQDIRFTFEQSTCSIKGTIREWPDHTSYRLDFKTHDGLFQDLLGVLPKEMTKWTRQISPRGKYELIAALRGRSGPHENPHLNVQLKQSQGSIFFPKANQSVTDIQYAILFDNGGARTAHSSTIKLQGFSGQYLGNSFEGEAQIDHLNFPMLNASFDGVLPVSLFNIDTTVLTFASGSLVAKDLKISDLWLELITPRSFLYSLDGTVNPLNVQLIYQGKELSVDSGQVRFEDGKTFFEDLFIQYSGSSGTVGGWLEGVGDAIESKHLSQIHYSATLEAGILHLDDFLSVKSTPEMASFGTGTARFVHHSQISLPSGDISGSVRSVQWGTRQMHDFLFDLQTTPQTMEGSVRLKTANGSVLGDVRLHCDQQYHLDMRLQFEELDLVQSFKQWNDFGQKLVRSRHLSGNAGGQLWMTISLDQRGKVIPKSLHSVMGIQILNGGLQDFEMLERFSKYIHIKDLRNLKFATLRNYIEIKNGHVYIPAMFIQSNAANLTINGVHGLDHRILYNLKINAGQVLTKQFKKYNPGLHLLPAQKEGFINLYYTIFGTTKDFKYESNKRGVLSSIQQSEQIKQRVLEKLKMEFEHVPEWREPEEWKDIPEYHTTHPDNQVQFLEVIKGKK